MFDPLRCTRKGTVSEDRSFVYPTDDTRLDGSDYFVALSQFPFSIATTEFSIRFAASTPVVRGWSGGRDETRMSLCVGVAPPDLPGLCPESDAVEHIRGVYAAANNGSVCYPQIGRFGFWGGTSSDGQHSVRFESGSVVTTIVDMENRTISFRVNDNGPTVVVYSDVKNDLRTYHVYCEVNGCAEFVYD